MKRITNFNYIIICCIAFACSKDDSEIQEEAQPLVGVFLDSPVSGLEYTALTFSGTTDENGNFDYAEGETVTFSVGGIQIGSSTGRAEVSPIDISGIDNSTINTVEVRNIATFLQSLDSDGNPSNGITITDATVSALEGATLEFDIDSFLEDLKELIASLNSENSTTLELVPPNAAALHLAESLGIEADFEILPRVITGREWEEGIYYPYNTNKFGEYLFNITSDLKGVRYNFGENFGYYMDMQYEQDLLVGNGSTYSDLDQNPPTESIYEYNNRFTSPGVVFDHPTRDTTYIGYYNYHKTDGTVGMLQGTYKGFLYFERKRPGEEPFTFTSFTNFLTISNPNEMGEFDVKIESFDGNGDLQPNPIISSIKQEHLDENVAMLIRFQSTDYLFFDFPNPMGLFPGIFASKVTSD
ncbi:MAG: hypothetical protein ABJG78_18625 [Cyclobacteriaceae bacterium]